MMSVPLGDATTFPQSVPVSFPNNLRCDGITDDTAAMLAFISKIGAIGTRLVFPNTGSCLLGNITFPSNISLDFTLGGGIKVITGQTVNIRGAVAGKFQIFFNALASQGTIDFTGGSSIEKVYPEWWGAVGNNSTGPGMNITTPAIQAAIIGAYGSNRTNGSGLSNYNRILHFSDNYYINDELKCYHMLGFRWEGENKLLTGITQNATNTRIIDGQSVAYGVFSNLRFSTSASQTVPLIDFDYNHSQGSDLAVQNITFNDCVISGNNIGQIGVLLAKTPGAQGDNIRFYNCYGNGFTEAAFQIGGNNTGINVGRFYANNAIQALWQGGDMQSCPHYGIAVYGGQVIVRDASFENGFATQTGFDVYCEATQGPCIMENCRSESRRLIAGGNIIVRNSYTINQAVSPNPPSGQPIGTIISGSRVGGDGIYYKVSGNIGGFGGVGTPTVTENATSGSLTTIVNGIATYAPDSFIGMRVSILSGSGTGFYGIVTGNNATTITVGGGWITQYLSMTPANPDATSKFIVEPNWGTQVTSGGITWAVMAENGIEGDVGGVGTAILDNVQVPGLRIRATGKFRDIQVTRADWNNAGFPLDNNIIATEYNNIRVFPGAGPTGASPLGIGGAAKYVGWKFPRNGGPTPYTDYSQLNLGTKSIVWSQGGVGGGTALPDTWVGINGFRLPTFLFTNLPGSGVFASNGVIIYCSDAKNATDDGATFDSAAVGGGRGAMLLRQNGQWRVH